MINDDTIYRLRYFSLKIYILLYLIFHHVKITFHHKKGSYNSSKKLFQLYVNCKYMHSLSKSKSWLHFSLTFIITLMSYFFRFAVFSYILLYSDFTFLSRLTHIWCFQKCKDWNNSLGNYSWTSMPLKNNNFVGYDNNAA